MRSAASWKKNCEAIALLILIDPSLADRAPEAETPGGNGHGHTIETERKFLEQLLPESPIPEQIRRAMQIEELWGAAVEHLIARGAILPAIKSNMPEPIRRIIPNFAEIQVGDLIYYLNAVRTIDSAVGGYRPSGKLNVQAHIFRATDNGYVNSGFWKKCFKKSVQFYDVKGDHFSIMSSRGWLSSPVFFPT